MELSPRTGSEPGPTRRRWAAWLVAALVLIPHGVGLSGGFVYDDYRFVSENPGIESLERPSEFFSSVERASTPIDRDIYRPLRTVGFALQHALFDDRAAGYHFVSLLLFGLVVVALIRWIESLGASPALALATGALFGVHPVTVESVAWISSQGDLAAAALGLFALSRLPDRPVTAIVCGSLALLAKESALPLVGLAAATVALGGRRLDARQRRLGWTIVASLAVVTVMFLLYRQHVLDRSLGQGSAGFAQLDSSFVERLLRAGHNILEAVRLTVWPASLAVDYSEDSSPATWLHFFAALILLGSAGVAAWRWDRQRPLAIFAVGASLAWFVPTCGLFLKMRSPIAERFLLLPLAAALLALVAGSTRLPRPIQQGGLALAILVLAILTFVRTADWGSQKTLFQAELEVHPQSIQAHIALAAEHADEGDIAKAREHFDLVVQLTTPADPRHVEGLYGRARLEMLHGESVRALRDLESAKQLLVESPDRQPYWASDVWLMLADILRGLSGPEAAEQIARDAIERFGRRPALLESLGVARDLQGSPLEAIKLHREAIATGEASPTVHFHLALALLKIDARDEAIAELERTLERIPDHPRARSLLAQLR